MGADECAQEQRCEDVILILSGLFELLVEGALSTSYSTM